MIPIQLLMIFYIAPAADGVQSARRIPIYSREGMPV